MNNKENKIIKKICLEICQEFGECLKRKENPNACENCKTVFFAWCVKKAIKKYKEKTR